MEAGRRESSREPRETHRVVDVVQGCWLALLRPGSALLPVSAIRSRWNSSATQWRCTMRWSRYICDALFTRFPYIKTFGFGVASRQRAQQRECVLDVSSEPLALHGLPFIPRYSRPWLAPLPPPVPTCRLPHPHTSDPCRGEVQRRGPAALSVPIILIVTIHANAFRSRPQPRLLFLVSSDAGLPKLLDLCELILLEFRR